MLARRLIAAVAIFCALYSPVYAQKTNAQLNTEIGSNFPDNTTGLIAPSNLRSVTKDIVNSIMPSTTVTNGDLACWNGTTGLLQDCGSAPYGGIANGHLLANATGSTNTPRDTAPSTWLDQAFCSTVGFIIARTTGGWVCSPGVTISPSFYGAACNGSTDDTTNLNTMLSSVGAGTTIQFPSSSCKTTGVLNVGKALNIKIPNGGGLTATGTGYAISVNASNVSISCEIGSIINGPRTPSTGNTYLAGNSAIFVSGVSATHFNNISVTGCGITNFEEAGIWAAFCDNCYLNNNSIQSVSYAGILCYVCTFTQANGNFINGVSSSNGPANGSLPVNTKTNAYGITFTTDGSGHFSQYDIAVNNIIENIPTWECLDTHAGAGIKFVNNHCINVRVGIQVTTDGGSIAPNNVLVLGNLINCIALNQPVYPGGSSISVGGAGIFVAGVASGAQANDIMVIANDIIQCGSSETGTAAQANIEVGDVQNVRIDSNNLTSGRYNGILIYDQVIGQFTSNNFNGIVNGPIGTQNHLINVATANCQCLLSQNFGNSSGSDGYFITGQSGGFEVGIARDNTFFNLSNLYDAGGPNTNRVDLGATAP